MDTLTAPTLSLSKSTSLKLRDILSPKPSITIPVNRPIVSFPSRLPARRKRGHREVAGDENDRPSSPRARAAHLRQRLTSDSTASVDTIREPRKRTTSQDSVRTVKNVPQARTRKSSLSRPTESLASELARATTTTTDLKDTKTEEGDEVLTIVSPAPLKSETSQKKRLLSKPPTTRTRKASMSGRPKAKGLQRTQSFRDLSGYSDDSDPDFTYPEAEISVFEVDDDDFDEWRRARDTERLSEEDEALIRDVVSAIVKDTDYSEGVHVSPVELTPGQIVTDDDLDDIPGLLYDRTDQSKSAMKPMVISPGCENIRSNLNRFDIILKPKSKHCTMWDVSLDDTYAWPGILYITDARPQPGLITRMPIRSIEIEWRSVNGILAPGETPADEKAEYQTTYEGQSLPGTEIVAKMNSALGICVDNYWSYLPPDLPGTGAGGAWALRFWVPVPMSLFQRCEHRTFHLRSRVTFGEWDMQPFIGHSGTVNVTIERLQSEREMRMKAKE